MESKARTGNRHVREDTDSPSLTVEGYYKDVEALDSLRLIGRGAARQ